MGVGEGGKEGEGEERVEGVCESGEWRLCAMRSAEVAKSRYCIEYWCRGR